MLSKLRTDCVIGRDENNRLKTNRKRIHQIYQNKLPYSGYQSKQKSNHYGQRNNNSIGNGIQTSSVYEPTVVYADICMTVNGISGRNKKNYIYNENILHHSCSMSSCK